MSDIADLRERVTIQRFSGADDGQGGRSATDADWTDVAIVWAQVTPQGTGERMAAERVEATITYTVRIRFRDDLADPREAAKHRIVWRGRAMNIRGAPNLDERRMYLDMACELGVGT